VIINKAKKALTDKSGFTLVEMITIIVMLGILLSIVSTVVINKSNEARKDIVMGECMECVASAQTLLVESQNYGTSFTVEKIKASAGVSGDIKLIRVVNGEVTHLYYVKGQDCYVYSRYYDEVDGSGNHNHNYYSIIGYDSEGNPIYDYNVTIYDQTGRVLTGKEASDYINSQDDHYGLDDEYNYIDYGILDEEAEAVQGDFYDDSDDDYDYDSDDPEQPTTREHVETTTTTTTEAVVEPTTSTATDADDGTFYSRILRYIYDTQLSGTLSSQADFGEFNGFPTDAECISSNGKRYAVYLDNYNGASDYYLVLYGASLDDVRVRLCAGYVWPENERGFNNETFSYAKNQVGGEAGFKIFRTAWDDAGYKEFTKRYFHNVLTSSGFTQYIYGSSNATSDSAKKDKIYKFSFNPSSVNTVDSFPSTGSEGQVVKYGSDYYVWLNIENSPNWYKVPLSGGDSLKF
jgi:Tfp pilus assembly protein PilE